MTITSSAGRKWIGSRLNPWATVPSGGNVARAMSAKPLLPTGWQSGYLGSAPKGTLLVTVVSVTVGGTAPVPAALARPRSPVGITTRDVDARPALRRQAAPEALTAREQIDRIQDVFSLTVTDLARVLGVSRPTLYAWLQEEVITPRDPEVAERLREVYEMAAAWEEQVDGQVGRFLKVPVVGDRSLLELLQQDPWDREAIERALSILQQKVAERLESRRAEHSPDAPVAEANSRQRERVRDALQRARLYRR
ncbi:hypothetical protein BH24GEM3_BH24GEM3_10080 [soil metagenome]